jgi:hypothetical protein
MLVKALVANLQVRSVAARHDIEAAGCRLCMLLPQAANIIADFFDKCAKDPGYWQRISKGGLERIYSR